MILIYFISNNCPVLASYINQEHFHQYFKLPEYNGTDDWIEILIDSDEHLGRSLEDEKVFGSINLTKSFLRGQTKGTYQQIIN